MLSFPPRSLGSVDPESRAAAYTTGDASPYQIGHLYQASESQALSRLVELKLKLKKSSQDDFFRNLCEGITSVSRSQFSFVAKRVFVDSKRQGAKQPSIHNPGPFLAAVHYYYDDGADLHGHGSNSTCLNVDNCTCTLTHQEGCRLIPSNLPRLLPNNLDALAVASACEAYLSIPLFAHEICVAHLCVMWSADGLSKQALGGGFLELLCRSVEDLITQQLENISRFSSTDPLLRRNFNESRSATMAPSVLERYAKKLSHELRTPLQGITGLSDLMHASLHDAVVTATSLTARNTFQNLKDDIEAIQSSSWRAVDAADNIVQAYELNMLLQDDGSAVVAEDQIDASKGESRGTKRKADGSNYFDRPARKVQIDEELLGFGNSQTQLKVLSAPCESQPFQNVLDVDASYPRPDTRKNSLCSPPFLQTSAPGLQLTDIRRCIRDLVNETVRRDDRLDLIMPSEADNGEVIEVHAIATNREIKVKKIAWVVDPAVPEYILVSQRDMVKSTTCVLHNALKFTDTGHVTLQVQYNAPNSSITINIKDTGPGISPSFQTEIFKPFSQEDDSISRCKEGLGLGLLVAKGLTQRLGGDLTLLSAEVSGPNRGSEFTLRIPISLTTEATPPLDADNNFNKPAAKKRTAENSKFSRRKSNSLSLSAAGWEGTTFDAVPSQIFPTPSVEDTDPIRPPPQPRFSQLTKLPPSPFSDADNEDYQFPRPAIPHSAPHASQSPITPPTSYGEFTHPSTSKSARRSKPSSEPRFDHTFAASHPLNFLVAEDNAVNRKILVKMLAKLGYDARTQIREACDGLDAVRQVKASAPDLLPGRRCSSAPPLYASQDGQPGAASAADDYDDGEPHFPTPLAPPIDVILMDLWMPNMDGYEATEKILQICRGNPGDPGADRRPTPLILAVTADATQASIERAAEAGMAGLMLKPFGMKELQRIVRDGWMRRKRAEASLWNGGRRWSEDVTADNAT